MQKRDADHPNEGWQKTDDYQTIWPPAYTKNSLETIKNKTPANNIFYKNFNEYNDRRVEWSKQSIVLIIVAIVTGIGTIISQYGNAKINADGVKDAARITAEGNVKAAQINAQGNISVATINANAAIETARINSSQKSFLPGGNTGTPISFNHKTNPALMSVVISRLGRIFSAKEVGAFAYLEPGFAYLLAPKNKATVTFIVINGAIHVSVPGGNDLDCKQGKTFRLYTKHKNAFYTSALMFGSQIQILDIQDEDLIINAGNG